MPKAALLLVTAIALCSCGERGDGERAMPNGEAALAAEAAERQANIDSVRRNPSVVDPSKASAPIEVRNNTRSSHDMSAHDMPGHARHN